MKLKNTLKKYVILLNKRRSIIVDKNISYSKSKGQFFKYSSNKKIYLAIVSCILVFSIMFTSPKILTRLANHLVYSTKLIEKADIIIVLAGGSGERVKKGTVLFNKGYATKIMFTGGPLFNSTFPFYMKTYAMSLNIPSQNIFLETNSFSTMDHPINLNPILQKMGTKSVIIVTSSYHSHRSFKTFKKYLNPSINIQIVPAPDAINNEHWWKHHEMAEKVIIEWIKTICYGIKYGIF